MVSEGDENIEVLKRHMLKHQLYALALTEVRLPHSGSMEVGDSHTLIWAGSPGDGSAGGVAWLLSPGASAAWRKAGCRARPFSSGRLLDITLALRGSEGVWHLVAAYGPTMQCGDSEKLTFWQDFETLCGAIPTREISFFVGDFNCRVGSRHHGGYPDQVLGPFGLGPRNSNGDSLLEFAVSQQMALLNTFFST